MPKDTLPRDILLRGERESDFKDIYEINRLAFGGDAEAKLITELRKCRNYLRGFSIVAVLENKVIGHAILTLAQIVRQGKRFNCLALGPMAVLPEHQRKGVGKQLVEEGILRAKENGYKAIIVIGHSEYYPKFGFMPAASKNIRTRFNVPPENFMVLELTPNALKNISGLAEYAKEFKVFLKDEQSKKSANSNLENEAIANNTAENPS